VKTLIGKPKYRGNNVKYEGMEYRAWKEVDRFIDSRYEQFRSSSEYGSELSGSIEGKDFVLEYLREYLIQTDPLMHGITFLVLLQKCDRFITVMCLITRNHNSKF